MTSCVLNSKPIPFLLHVVVLLCLYVVVLPWFVLNRSHRFNHVPHISVRFVFAWAPCNIWVSVEVHVHVCSVIETKQSKATTPKDNSSFSQKSCLRRDLNPRHSVY